MKSPAVKLFLRIRRADGRQMRVKPAIGRNNLVRPLWAVVDGEARHHPEGTYVIRFRDRDGRRHWLAVGNDLNAALAARARKEKELALSRSAAELGITITGLDNEGGVSTRVKISDAISQYLDDIKGSKAHKTWLCRKRVASYFQQSCSKCFLDEVDRRDLLDFRAFLYRRKLSDRSVYNMLFNAS